MHFGLAAPKGVCHFARRSLTHSFMQNSWRNEGKQESSQTSHNIYEQREIHTKPLYPLLLLFWRNCRVCDLQNWRKNKASSLMHAHKSDRGNPYTIHIQLFRLNSPLFHDLQTKPFSLSSSNRWPSQTKTLVAKTTLWGRMNRVLSTFIPDKFVSHLKWNNSNSF